MDSKLIFFDIDGTLALEPSGIIPDSTGLPSPGQKKTGIRCLSTQEGRFTVSVRVSAPWILTDMCADAAPTFITGEKSSWNLWFPILCV